jgi:spore germination protein KB
VLNGFFLVLSILVVIATFGPNVASTFIFATFDAIRMVSLANFLERLDAAMVAIWMLGGVVKVGVFYYAAVLGSAQWLGLKDYRPLVMPVGVILLGLAALCPNVVDLLGFISMTWPPYALLIFEAGIPLMLLTVALVRRKQGNAFD